MSINARLYLQGSVGLNASKSIPSCKIIMHYWYNNIGISYQSEFSPLLFTCPLDDFFLSNNNVLIKELFHIILYVRTVKSVSWLCYWDRIYCVNSIFRLVEILSSFNSILFSQSYFKNECTIMLKNFNLQCTRIVTYILSRSRTTN